jgi:ferritin-like metal-binding protein YciE
MNLDREKLEIFFIEHLDKIYCAKQHLISRLPQLVEQAYFSDLKEAITNTIENVKTEITRMDMIYELMEVSYSDCATKGLVGFIEDAFVAINKQGPDVELRDLSSLFYLQNIESVEMASFQILQMTAVKLKNKQIGKLLKENYEQAKSNRTLLLLIASKYIISDLG